MKISREDFEQLEMDFQVRDDYSGRGMYGEKCFGIVGSLVDLLTMINVIIELGLNIHIETLARSPQQDNMGREMIYYFPNLQVEDKK